MHDLVLLIPGEYIQCTDDTDRLKDFEDSARLVAQNARDLGAAMVVIYGNDGIADLAWSRSRKQALRNDIPTPVLLISEADGEKVVSLLATEQLETQLSKKPYCDSVYKYGIPLGNDQTPVCCAAADATMACNLFTSDYTICPQNLGGLDIECEEPQHASFHAMLTWTWKCKLFPLSVTPVYL